MRASQLDNYINSNPLYNSTHFTAWGLAKRLQRWGWHNLKHRFLPPQINAIMVHPLNIEVEPEEPFTFEMFQPGGFLHETQLNHYIIFNKPWFLINVGYLWHHFAISDDYGYAEFKRMIEIARKEKALEEARTPTAPTAEGSSDEVQAKSSQNPE